jgi:hypothetical protein
VWWAFDTVEERSPGGNLDAASSDDCVAMNLVKVIAVWVDIEDPWDKLVSYR